MSIAQRLHGLIASEFNIPALPNAKKKANKSLRVYGDYEGSIINDYINKRSKKELHPSIYKHLNHPDIKITYNRHIQNIDNLFKTTPHSHTGGKIYRHIYADPNHFELGKIYKQPHYMSTTNNKEVHQQMIMSYNKGKHKGKNISLHLHLPKNYPVLNTDNHRKYAEHEHLLPRNTRYRIIHKITYPTHTEIHAKILSHKHENFVPPV